MLILIGGDGAPAAADDDILDADERNGRAQVAADRTGTNGMDLDRRSAIARRPPERPFLRFDLGGRRPLFLGEAGGRMSSGRAMLAAG